MSNRRQRRQLSRYGLGQQMMDEAATKLMNNTKTMAYRLAFGGMMKALADHWGFGKEQLDELAIYTVQNINTAVTPTDLRDELLELTGFDVDRPIEAEKIGIEV